VSDGTINLIATLTALYEPYEKSLIAIEEPERHLHLRAISYLMEEFRNISEKKPILITTQSTEILHNLDLKKDNLIFLFRDYEGNTKAITHRDIARFKQKLKAYNNDIVKLIKLEGLGYLGDYIGEEG
jgi:predicted ATPase